MESLVMVAKSRESAETLLTALADFAPKSVEGDDGRVEIVVDVSRERRLLGVLDVLQAWLGEHGESASVSIGERSYTLNPGQ
jgi:hypothetical protein